MAKVDDVQWMRGARIVNSGAKPGWKPHQELVVESLKKWALRYLPDAVQALKSEVPERYGNGSLSAEQLDCAAHAFNRMSDGEGFDVHREVWENLRTAAGHPFRN